MSYSECKLRSASWPLPPPPISASTRIHFLIFPWRSARLQIPFQLKEVDILKCDQETLHRYCFHIPVVHLNGNPSSSGSAVVPNQRFVLLRAVVATQEAKSFGTGWMKARCSPSCGGCPQQTPSSRGGEKEEGRRSSSSSLSFYIYFTCCLKGKLSFMAWPSDHYTIHNVIHPQCCFSSPWFRGCLKQQAVRLRSFRR